MAIGLGASMGQRLQTLQRTVAQLAARPGWRLVRCSRWYRSAPMRGGTAAGWFLNGVAVFDTDQPPHGVLRTCRDLEERAGRRRARFWGDRTLDLDVLWIEGVTLQEETLTVPHPGIGQRPFVWWPLREAWPELREELDRRHPHPPRPQAVPSAVFARRPQSQ